MQKQISLGVVIGRFQLIWPHSGHRYLLDRVSRDFDQLVILVGQSNYRWNIKNWLPFQILKHRLQSLYPAALILPFRDSQVHPREWSVRLDATVRALPGGEHATLCGSRDSFEGLYSGDLPVRFYEPRGKHAATAIREQLLQQPPPTDPELLDAYLLGRFHGVASVYENYPITEPTVDVAMYRPDWSQVLMARRMPGLPLRFFGGHADRKDLDLEEAALREAREEAGAGLVLGRPAYVASPCINERRVRDTGLLIRTTLFAIPYLGGEIRLGDDMALGEVEWIDIRESSLQQVTPSHRDLFHALVRHKTEQLEKR